MQVDEALKAVFNIHIHSWNGQSTRWGFETFTDTFLQFTTAEFVFINNMLPDSRKIPTSMKLNKAKLSISLWVSQSFIQNGYLSNSYPVQASLTWVLRMFDNVPPTCSYGT